jgi:hypothetical protein
MQESLVTALIEAARECNEGDVRVIITPIGDGKPTYIGSIDLKQSNNKILSLRAVDIGEPKEDGPTYRFPRGCVRHVAYAGDRNGEPVYWFIIDGMHSLTGVRIKPEEFYKLNDVDSGGCWPSGFTHSDPNVYVYLKAVEFEDGLVSRDIAFTLDEINCCGERG